MSEIPGQSGQALPDLKPPVCARSDAAATHIVVEGSKCLIVVRSHSLDIECRSQKALHARERRLVRNGVVAKLPPSSGSLLRGI